MKTKVLAVFALMATLVLGVSCEPHKWDSTKRLFEHGDSHGDAHHDKGEIPAVEAAKAAH